MLRVLLSVFCLITACVVPLSADITISRLFSDHMVLQQKSEVKIWGTANAGQKIIVEFNQQAYEALTDENGNWQTQIATPAAGGPFQILVRPETGDPKILLTDILVGEVWICSGQSNMEWPVEKSNFPEKEIDSAKEFPNVRLFTIDRNASTTPVANLVKAQGWDVSNPETVRTFSAVGYFFGRQLNKDLNVPIGLIHVSWGGTRCEAWTSMEALMEDGSFQGLLDSAKNMENPAGPNHPANLFNGMISPLKGVSFQGVIWYQGEANVGRGSQYARLFPRMIDNWRKVLAGGREFPFLFVGLAPFRYNSSSEESLAEVWDAQLHTYRSVPATGMVITSDIGNVDDIHPRNKQDVGLRLAAWALNTCYRSTVSTETPLPIPSGPIYRAKEVVGKEIRLSFDFVGGGLKVKGEGALTDFTICGGDQKFVAAQARIDGDQIVVWSEEISGPTDVRYGWNNIAAPNLINAEGLPAAPFRTDRFSLSSEGVEF